MAVRLSAAEALYRTSDLPTNTNLTMCGWFRMIVDTNDFATCFAVVAPSSSDADSVQTDGSGTTMGTYTNNDNWSLGPNWSLNTWYHVAMVCNSSSVDYYLNGVLESDGNDGHSSVTSQSIVVGSYHHSTLVDEFNGEVAFVKVWDDILTQAEIANEMWTIVPQKQENIHLWSPLFPGSTERVKDYSGNGRNWTEGGTITDAVGPPIAWDLSGPVPLAPQLGSTWTLQYKRSVLPDSAYRNVPIG